MKSAPIYAIIASLSFSLMYAAIKLLNSGYNVFQILFFRSAIPLFILIIFLLKDTYFLKTNKLKNHFIRSIFGILSMICIFLSASKISLISLTLIIFTMPLIVGIISPIILGEKIRKEVYFCSFLGFIGILIGLGPLDGEVNFYHIIALLGSFFYAMVAISVRKLGETDSVLTTFFYFTLFCIIFSSITLPTVWINPNFLDLLIFIFIGLMGATGQYSMVRAYKEGNANFIAPFEYLQFLWALILGIFIWDDNPDVFNFLAAFCIILSTLILSRKVH
tara:strand:+ start:6945 stop:7775 length:831 start_codon:yes stop_codon:yes gene_type:complete